MGNEQPVAYADVIKQAAVTLSFFTGYKNEKERRERQVNWEAFLREDIKKRGYKIIETYRDA